MCCVIVKMPSAVPVTESNAAPVSKKKDKNKKGKKQPLTKNDIGARTNFLYVIVSFFHAVSLLVRSTLLSRPNKTEQNMYLRPSAKSLFVCN